MTIVALALCFRDDRWLVDRRAEHVHLPGLWEFPGGKILPGESPPHAAVRELAEELGVRARPLQALPALPVDYPDSKLELHPIVCNWLAGNPKPMVTAVVEAKWVSYEELKQLSMPPVNDAIIEELAGVMPITDDQTLE